MRNALLSLILILAVSLSAMAQTSQSATKGWERVQAVPSGSSLNIHAKGHSGGCKVKSVDADSITCVHGDGTTTEVIQKADVKKIRVGHRGTSTVAGLAIGVGVGAGIGAGIGAAQGQGNIGISKSQATGIFVSIGIVVFGLIGALVGAATDFIGSTIYKG